ncbi:MAG: molybdopterin-dependent oxidoreductase [Collinsella sp.]
MRPGLAVGHCPRVDCRGLYDHEFVARYTTGFDELAQAAALGRRVGRVDVRRAGREIVATARDLAAAAPAAVVDAGFHGGIGIAYANSTQTARAICLVDVLLGCIGHAGGALNPPTPLVLGDLDPARFATPPVPRGPKLGSERYPLVDPVRGLCTTIGQSILAGDLRGLIVYASNPGAGYGNAQAWLGILQQLDLLVTIDIRWSETARASDFVLPDVTYLEADRGLGTVVGRNDARVFYRNAVLRILHDDTVPVGRSLPVWRRPVAWASTSSLRLTIWRLPRWRRLGSSGRAQGARLGRHRCCVAVAYG